MLPEAPGSRQIVGKKGSDMQVFSASVLCGVRGDLCDLPAWHGAAWALQAACDWRNDDPDLPERTLRATAAP